MDKKCNKRTNTQKISFHSGQAPPTMTTNALGQKMMHINYHSRELYISYLLLETNYPNTSLLKVTTISAGQGLGMFTGFSSIQFHVYCHLSPSMSSSQLVTHFLVAGRWEESGERQAAYHLIREVTLHPPATSWLLLATYSMASTL